MTHPAVQGMGLMAGVTVSTEQAKDQLSSKAGSRAGIHLIGAGSPWLSDGSTIYSNSLFLQEKGRDQPGSRPG